MNGAASADLWCHLARRASISSGLCHGGSALVHSRVCSFGQRTARLWNDLIRLAAVSAGPCADGSLPAASQHVPCRISVSRVWRPALWCILARTRSRAHGCAAITARLLMLRLVDICLRHAALGLPASCIGFCAFRFRAVFAKLWMPRLLHASLWNGQPWPPTSRTGPCAVGTFLLFVQLLQSGQCTSNLRHGMAWIFHANLRLCPSRPYSANSIFCMLRSLASGLWNGLAKLVLACSGFRDTWQLHALARPFAGRLGRVPLWCGLPRFFAVSSRFCYLRATSAFTEPGPTRFGFVCLRHGNFGLLLARFGLCSHGLCHTVERPPATRLLTVSLF